MLKELRILKKVGINKPNVKNIIKRRMNYLEVEGKTIDLIKFKILLNLFGWRR